MSSQKAPQKYQFQEAYFAQCDNIAKEACGCTAIELVNNQKHALCSLTESWLDDIPPAYALNRLCSIRAKEIVAYLYQLPFSVEDKSKEVFFNFPVGTARQTLFEWICSFSMGIADNSWIPVKK